MTDRHDAFPEHLRAAFSPDPPSAAEITRLRAAIAAAATKRRATRQRGWLFSGALLGAAAAIVIAIWIWIAPEQQRNAGLSSLPDNPTTLSVESASWLLGEDDWLETLTASVVESDGDEIDSEVDFDDLAQLVGGWVSR
ncbi:MAG: hypothetical protein H6707_03715 [Deltaproteobacteria bacterium]|nr:hypothetical protein [Deltaproteobacteria bacterium]